MKWAFFLLRSPGIGYSKAQGVRVQKIKIAIEVLLKALLRVKMHIIKPNYIILLAWLPVLQTSEKRGKKGGGALHNLTILKRT